MYKALSNQADKRKPTHGALPQRPQKVTTPLEEGNRESWHKSHDTDGLHPSITTRKRASDSPPKNSAL